MIHRRRLRFARKLTALYDQLRYFPHRAHDDGPDALELCLEVLGEIGWVMLDVAPPTRPEVPMNDAQAPTLAQAATQQIQHRFQAQFEWPEAGTRCGECLHMAASGRCSLREFLVEPGDPRCDAFDPRASA